MNNEETVFDTGKYKNLNWERVNQNIGDVFSLFGLMFNRYLHSKTTIIVYLFPLIGFLGAVIMLPAYLSIALEYSSSLLFSGLIIYGVTFYNLKKSTIYKSLAVSRYNYFKIYLAIFFLILVTNFLLFTFITLIYGLLMWTSHLTNNFPPPLGEPRSRGMDFITAYYVFFQASWGVFFYYFLLASISVFTTSLLIQSIAKNLKAYMIISITYGLLGIVFGGTLIINFPVLPSGEYQFENNQQLYVLDPDNVFAIDTDEQLIWIYPMRLSKGNDGGYYNVAAPTGFGASSFDLIWWISQLLPIYFLNELAFSSFQQTHILSSSDTQTQVIYNPPDGGQSISLNGYDVKFGYLHFNNPEWASICLVPYFLIIIYGALGFLISIKTKKTW